MIPASSPVACAVWLGRARSPRRRRARRGSLPQDFTAPPTSAVGLHALAASPILRQTTPAAVDPRKLDRARLPPTPSIAARWLAHALAAAGLRRNAVRPRCAIASPPRPAIRFTSSKYLQRLSASCVPKRVRRVMPRRADHTGFELGGRARPLRQDRHQCAPTSPPGGAGLGGACRAGRC